MEISWYFCSLFPVYANIYRTHVMFISFHLKNNKATKCLKMFKQTMQHQYNTMCISV